MACLALARWKGRSKVAGTIGTTLVGVVAMHMRSDLVPCRRIGEVGASAMQVARCEASTESFDRADRAEGDADTGAEELVGIGSQLDMGQDRQNVEVAD